MWAVLVVHSISLEWANISEVSEPRGTDAFNVCEMSLLKTDFLGGLAMEGMEGVWVRNCGWWEMEGIWVWKLLYLFWAGIYESIDSSGFNFSPFTTLFPDFFLDFLAHEFITCMHSKLHTLEINYELFLPYINIKIIIIKTLPEFRPIELYISSR